MCDPAVDDCPSALRFASDWFVTDKMIRKLHETLFANYILLFDEDFGKVTFCDDKMAILSLDLDKSSLDDVDFYESAPETMTDFWLGVINLKNAKHLKRYIS